MQWQTLVLPVLTNTIGASLILIVSVDQYVPAEKELNRTERLLAVIYELTAVRWLLLPRQGRPVVLISAVRNPAVAR